MIFPFIVLIIASLVIYSLSYIAAKLIDMWFKRKPKPTKMLDIVCPRTGKPLTSEEVFFGMCGSCYRQNEVATKNNVLFCHGGVKSGSHVKS